MIKNIVFDMGKVLLDYDPMPVCRHYADNEEDAKIICNALFVSKYWALTDLGLLTDEEAIEEVAVLLPDKQLFTVLKKCMDNWHRFNLWPHKNIDSLVQELSDRKLDLYILSNASTRFRVYQSLIPKIDLFKGIMVSAEEHCVKPDRQIYQRLFEKFAIKPEDSIFIDDLEDNIKAAADCGMSGYCFSDGDVGRLRQYLISII